MKTEVQLEHTTSSSLSVRSAWISQLYRAMWNSSSWDLWARPSICSNFKGKTGVSLEIQIMCEAVTRNEHQLSTSHSHELWLLHCWACWGQRSWRVARAASVHWGTEGQLCSGSPAPALCLWCTYNSQVWREREDGRETLVTATTAIDDTDFFPILPFQEGLLSHSVLLRLSVLVEVGSQSLWILLVCCCEAQLKDSLVETHCETG